MTNIEGITTLGFSSQKELLSALQAVRNGDFSVRLPGDWAGIDGKIADTFNEIVTPDYRPDSQGDERGSREVSGNYLAKPVNTEQLLSACVCGCSADGRNCREQSIGQQSAGNQLVRKQVVKAAGNRGF